VANIKSQKKRNITNEKARMRNRAIKSELKTAVRRVHEAVEAENGAEAYAAALQASRLFDKAAAKGIIHKNQAANRKSGIMKLANTVVSDDDRKAYVKPEPKTNKTGSKKAERKAERKAAQKKASEEKAKRREETLKLEAKAAKRKAKEAEEAAKAEAEAEAAAEAEAGEEAEGAEEAPAEESAE
jgi:small subunit ribosomal protein S20